jgi:subtilisin-like proprotein convertase family protein
MGKIRRIDPAARLARAITCTLLVAIGARAGEAPQLSLPTAPVVVTNPLPITLNDNAPATPYPSTIFVSGLPGYLGDVQVRLNGLSHSFPADLDLLLVDPGGRALVLMSDVGNAVDATNATVTIDDHTADPLPRANPLVSGRFRARDYSSGDVFPAPAPAGPYKNAAPVGGDNLFSAFRGFSPNGTWSLYIVDDSAQDAGTISGGWSLILTEEFVYGGGAITIGDNAPATPYPSTVNVTGLPHKVLDVQLVIGGFTHTCPGDVDMLLVAPNGRAFVPMSDVGGCGPGVTSITFRMSDQAPAPMQSTVALTQLGEYKPSNAGVADVFPAPAPLGPYRQPGSVGADGFDTAFDGVDPNGTWSLYVVDDVGNDAGSLSFWNLIIVAQAEFTNSASVTVTDNSPAAPYPVTVPVNDVPGTLERTWVRVNGLTHSFPDDVDLMLAAPSGRALVVQSDAGGSNDVANITYTIDDDAGSAMDDTAALVDGAQYRPTNYGAGDAFPPSAPQSGVADAAPGGSATFASVFGGDTANGAWRLFLQDDSGNDSGTISAGFTVGVVMIYENIDRDGFDD